MTTCPSTAKCERDTLAIAHTPTGGLLALPSSALCKIFFALSDESTKPHSNCACCEHFLDARQCKHAWIRPAFHLACANSQLYLLYCKAVYGSHVEADDALDFITTDCGADCFKTVLSGLSLVRLARRGTSSLFDAEFTVVRKIPKLRAAREVSNLSETVWERFTTENSTLSTSQVDTFFDNAACYPFVTHVELSNVSSRESAELWGNITNAWWDCLESLTIEDSFCQFRDSFLYDIARLRRLRRLVISSQAVQWVAPLHALTSMKELVLHTCRISDAQVAYLLAHMKQLEVLDVTETCVTPSIVSCLPATLIRFAGGDRDAYCGDPEKEDKYAPLPPIDVRQAVLTENYAWDDDDDDEGMFTTHHKSDWNNVVVIPRDRFPRLKYLEWGEWRGHRQGVRSLLSIMSQLESLCLCGPDYDDELCDALLHSPCLRSIELYGCNITDITARVLADHPSLEFVNITKCKRVTPRGLYDICTGQAVRNETLENVLFFGQMQMPFDALGDLLEEHRDLFSDAGANDVSDNDSEMSVDEHALDMVS